jgi:hypothetical protein
LEVVCDEHGIGEYFGGNDTHLEGKCVPHAVLIALEPGVIGAVALSRRSANSSA